MIFSVARFAFTQSSVVNIARLDPLSREIACFSFRRKDNRDNLQPCDGGLLDFARFVTWA